MRPLSRILMVVLVAGFAGAFIVHNAAAASMAMAMTLGDSGGMTGCDGCGPGGEDDTKSVTCDIVCLTSPSVVPGAGYALPPMSAGRFADNDVAEYVGRTGPPEPFPPQSFILN